MRILIVEGNTTTSQSIELMLTRAKFSVSRTGLGKDAIDLAKDYGYDLMTLELDLPDISGYEVLRQLRHARVETPILILTESDDAQMKIKAFDFGADDYLTKPFHREELVARIHAIIRRSKGHSHSVIRTGHIAINIDTKTIEVDGKPMHLTRKEYEIMELLSLRKGAALTRETFFSHLYGGRDEPEISIIAVLICNLRKKLVAVCGGINYIETVPGRGYRLTESADPPPKRHNGRGYQRDVEG